MTKFRIFGIIFILYFSLCLDSYSQDEVVFFTKEIQVYDYRVMLNANSGGYFTGSIEVIDKYNNSVLYVDNLYSGFNSDTLLDLNRDGKEELILDLGTGINMYDYNIFLIFDFTLDSPLVAEIHNAELVENSNGELRILSNVRMSPAVMGAGYVYPMKYEDGKLNLDSNAELSGILMNQEPDEILNLIKVYSKETEECAEESMISNYYLSYLIQKRISGEEVEGWEFFDKNYNCKDKESVRVNLKNESSGIYEYISNPSNFKFNSQRN